MQTHTPEYLQRYSDDHLFYEVEMFFRMGNMLMVGRFMTQPPERARILNNAVLEGFGLHLRNLLDFFYTAPRKSDVAAPMFYDTAQLPPDFPSESAILKEAHRRAHKEMNHLTTERHWEGDPKKAWNFSQLMKEVKPLVEKFSESASAARLHPAFIDRIKPLLTDCCDAKPKEN